MARKPVVEPADAPVKADGLAVVDPLVPTGELRGLSKAQLIALVGVLRQFGPVEGAVRAALVGIPPGGVGAARAALALSLARLVDDPPATAKLSEVASASKEVRAVLKELDLERDDGRGSFFDDLEEDEGG
jgi:hypothetical protein